MFLVNPKIIGGIGYFLLEFVLHPNALLIVKTKNKVLNMLTFNGLNELIMDIKQLPNRRFMLLSKQDTLNRMQIMHAEYFLAQTDEEEINLEKNESYKYWLDVQTLNMIILLRKEKSINASVEELSDAVLFYLEKDTFME